MRGTGAPCGNQPGSDSTLGQLVDGSTALLIAGQRFIDIDQLRGLSRRAMASPIRP